jgi:hypothetical protein
MGKALTFRDRYDEHKPLPTKCLATGASAARELIRVLGKTETGLEGWVERAPPAARDPEEALAILEDTQELVEKLDPKGLGVVLSLAYKLQAGERLPDDPRALAAAAAETTGAPQRPEGPMSALLAAGLDTIWLPRPMRFAWDGPFGTVASLVQLRADVAALPPVLRSEARPVAELEGAWSVVRTFEEALEAAGEARCLSMSG